MVVPYVMIWYSLSEWTRECVGKAFYGTDFFAEIRELRLDVRWSCPLRKRKDGRNADWAFVLMLCTLQSGAPLLSEDAVVSRLLLLVSQTMQLAISSCVT
jgi:hypothetical protein